MVRAVSTASVQAVANTSAAAANKPLRAAVRDAGSRTKVGSDSTIANATRRKAEDGVAVDEQVSRADRARQPVVRGLREPADLGPAQQRIRGDDADGCVHRWGLVCLRRCDGGLPSPNVRARRAPHVPVRDPRQPGRGLDRRTGRVDDRQRRHRDSSAGQRHDHRGHADTTLHPATARTGAGADRPPSDAACTGRRCGALAELGRRTVAEASASPEIEDHCGRHHGHDVRRLGTDNDPELHAFEIGHHTVRRGKTVGTATGQAHGVDAVDQVAGVEGVGLACARPAAAHVDGGDRAIGREYHRRSGLPAAPKALVVADAQPCDVSQRASAERVVRPRRGGGHDGTVMLGPRQREADRR